MAQNLIVTKSDKHCIEIKYSPQSTLNKRQIIWGCNKISRSWYNPSNSSTSPIIRTESEAEWKVLTDFAAEIGQRPPCSVGQSRTTSILFTSHQEAMLFATERGLMTADSPDVWHGMHAAQRLKTKYPKASMSNSLPASLSLITMLQLILRKRTDKYSFIL